MRHNKKPKKASVAKFNKNNELSYTPNYLTHLNTAKVTDLSNLSIAMQQVIKDAYTVFSQYAAPEHFSVCTACCVSIEEERALRTLPLPVLPRELIYTYNNSAQTSLFGKHEVAYLLPRILELVALNETIHHSNELNLCRLAEVPANQWTEKETAILNRFALQYTKDEFHQAELSQDIVDIDEILIMFCRAGINIEPILDYIAQCNNFYVMASVALLISYAKNKNHYITNAFVDQCPQINEIFNQWLKKSAIQLQQNAACAIMNPKDLSKHLNNTKYFIEQGICELSELA